jgi:hypothetical protein
MPKRKASPDEEQKPKRPPRGKRMPVALNGRMPAVLSRRVPSPQHFTPAEIKQKVQDLLDTNLSNERNTVVGLLNRFLVLTETTLFRLVHEQVAISDNPRSFGVQLGRYRKQGLIANVGMGIIKKVEKAGLQAHTGNLRAYRLGVVGEAYVREAGFCPKYAPPADDQIHMAHDLLCAEAMVRLQELYPSRSANPGNIKIRGAREVLVWDEKRDVPLYAPDGLLIKTTLGTNEFERAFVVEFQNEYNDFLLGKVEEKVARISRTLNNDGGSLVWRERWKLPQKPFILMIYRDQQTLEVFKAVLQSYNPRNRYAATALSEIWNGDFRVQPLHDGEQQ